MISSLLSLLVGIALGSESVAPRLRSAVLRELPAHARVTLSALRVNGSISKGADVVVLGPHPPLGLVNFQVAGRDRSKKTFGSVVVSAVAKVAVAKSPIRHAEVFTPENVSYEERDLQPIAGTGYWLEGGGLEKRRAQGYLAPGSIVGLGNTSLPSVVERGQLVDLVLERSGLRITAKVKALEGGKLEQWIRVENPTTRRQLVARVAGAGEVRVR